MRVSLPAAVCIGLLALSSPSQVPVAPPHPDLALGRPVSAEELAAWKETVGTNMPSRWKVEKLSNGGWTIRLPDGRPFLPIGIDYEPLSMYDGLDWALMERDFDLIRDAGFNTITAWCINFHSGGKPVIRLTLEDMTRLAEMARARGLFIQFYLNIDRLIHLFPTATLADGTRHHFDIDYCDPGYREFVRNYARRIAMALHPFENVSTIVPWEEKIGLSCVFGDEKTEVKSLFGSAAGKKAFADWLARRDETVARLNVRWGTGYTSFDEAVDRTLREYDQGVPNTDRRQHDVLEFGQVMLVDFTRDFVEAYKAVDSTMLFQCRNWDLFGPVNAVHPGYGFLDTFGMNNYSMGWRAHDMNLRQEVWKTKLVAGVTGTAPYIGNFGFRTPSADRGTHGLVPNANVKAEMAADATCLWSYLPELAGHSYFQYFYKAHEGPWGIIKDTKGEPLPIYHSLKAVHSLLSCLSEQAALSDYAAPADVFVFHGLDAIYELFAKSWFEHLQLSIDLTEMNIHYEVLTDAPAFDVKTHPVIIALFQTYDRKLDADVAAALVRYCEEGGTLVIGNSFGRCDRNLLAREDTEARARALRGFDVSGVRRGNFKVRGRGMPELSLEDTYYVNVAPDSAIPDDAQVLLEMEADGVRQPGLVRRRVGKGTVYYFLFNPFFQGSWGGEPETVSRKSLVVTRCLMRRLGIRHDTRFGNRGFDLVNGRINLREKPIHYPLCLEAPAVGFNADEYGETDENYSGGVFTDDLVSFRGRRFKERGWRMQSSRVTSFAAGICSNELAFFTTDPVELRINKAGWSVEQACEPFRIYRLPAP